MRMHYQKEININNMKFLNKKNISNTNLFKLMTYLLHYI